MHVKAAILSVLALAGSAVSATAQSLDSLAKDPNLFIRLAAESGHWKAPAEPRHIIGPVYFVGTAGLGCWLITSTEGHILINTGMPGSGPMIEQSIRKLGFNIKDIKILLCGHAHVDHAGALAYLKAVTGARMFALHQETALLESGGKTDFQYGAYPESFGFEPVKVDQELPDGAVIKSGAIRLQMIHTPGHTRGAATYLLNIKDHSSTYRVVFPDGVGVNPGYRLCKDPSYPGIAADYRKSFTRLEQLHPDIWLAAHLESFSSNSKKAWVDPEGYRKWITSKKSEFQKAVKTCTQTPGKN